MSVVTYVNGQYVSEEGPHIPADERGHQFGDGVYEVVRVYSGRPFLLDWHLERFEASLAALAIANPHSRAEWIDLIGEAIRRSNEAESTVYWQVTRGIAPRAHVFPKTAAPSVSLSVRPYHAAPDSDTRKLVCLPDERWANVYIKTINLLPNVIAKEIASQSGSVEALLVRDGVVTEGSSSNAWFVRNGVLYTAPANRRILAGITRRFVLSLAERLGIPVREQAVSLDHLSTVDEVLMTGTTIEVLPIDEVLVNPALEPALRRLSDERPDLEQPWERASEVMWRQSGSSEVATRLRAAFDEAIEQFRMGELEVVTRRG